MKSDHTINSDECAPLLVATSQPSDNFHEVEPTKALLLSSQPCEKKAAAIINKSRKAMQDENISDVLYRYLQNKGGANGSLVELTGYAYSLFICLTAIAIFNVVSFFCTAFSTDNSNNAKMQIAVGAFDALSIFTLIPSFFSLGVVLADIQNIRRYRNTGHQCFEWLREKLTTEQFTQIKTLELNTVGIFALKQFIANEKFPQPTENVQKKLGKLSSAQ